MKHRATAAFIALAMCLAPFAALADDGRYIDDYEYAEPGELYYQWDGVIYRMVDDHAEFESFLLPTDEEFEAEGGTVAVLHEVVDGLPMITEELSFSFDYTTTSVTLSKGIRSIDFSDCYVMEHLVFSDTVTEIADYGLAHNRIKRLILPPTVQTIGEYAFWNGGLKEVVLPEGLEMLNAGLFEDCYSLRSVTLPSTITTIGGCVFLNTALASLDIPEATTQIDPSAFVGCDDLIGFNVHPENEAYYSVDGLLYSREDNLLLRYPPARSDAYDLPEGTKAFHPLAFLRNASLRSISLPNGIEELGDFSFASCTSLERVSLPLTLLDIPAGLFENCIALQAITVPPGVRSIGHGAFYNCATLERVFLSEGLECIDANAFSFCESLRELRIPASVDKIGGEAFADCAPDFTLIVAEGSFAQQYAQENRIPYRVE